VTEYPTEEGFFSARDGMRLFFQIVRPRTDPVAHIALLHGYAEHLGRYSEERARHLGEIGRASCRERV